jgi:hypothetical protein
LQTEVANLKAALATANGQLSVLDGRLKTIEAGGGGGGSTNPVLTELARYVKVVPGTLNDLKGPHVIFYGANVHVESGMGTTDEAGASSGLGNLVVGYNEKPLLSGVGLRDGSHNLVVGPSHAFTSTGGVAFGSGNLISAQYGTVLGGVANRSRAFASSILGGNGNSVSIPETSYPQ